MTRRKRTKPALRIALGTWEEPFASPWRFRTHGTSSYLAHRALASTFKASFHPATQHHPSATWTFGFTSESKQRFPETGSRRSHTWRQAPEFLPGWYLGPAIGTPRLPDRPYDLPPGEAEFRQATDLQWVDAPAFGNSTFLMVFLSDDRPELPPLEILEEDRVIGTLPMTNGWHLSIVSSERPLREEELRPVYEIRDEMKLGIDRAPRPGSESGSIVWVTTSPGGPPLFVHIVLGSDNFEQKAHAD